MGHRLPTIGWKIQTRAVPEEKNKSEMKNKIICAEESDLPPCWRHSYIHRSWRHLTDPCSHFWAVLFGHWGHIGLGAPRLAQATWVSRSWGPVTSPECTWYTSTTFYMHASAWYISPTASSARLVERGWQWWGSMEAAPLTCLCWMRTITHTFTFWFSTMHASLASSHDMAF